MIEQARLDALLERFPRLNIGLVGDLFLDRYLDIDPGFREVSVETGLEAYQVTRVRNSPGALGTVMNNLAALGVGRLAPVTVIGDDGHGLDLRRALGELPASIAEEFILGDPQRLTPTYTKPIQRGADGTWRELNRLDLRTCAALSGQTQQRLLDCVTRVWEQTDGLIVTDQVNEEGFGVVSPGVRDHLAQLAGQHPEKLLFVDSRARIAQFRCGTLKPNAAECLAALGQDETRDVTRISAAASRLSRKTRRPMFVTCGEQGMLVVEPDGEPVLVPGYPASGPIDVVGAGDSATAAIVASLLAGASRVEAATVGNLVASITVTQIGTTGTARPDQVRQRWQQTR